MRTAKVYSWNSKELERENDESKQCELKLQESKSFLSNIKEFYANT